MHCTTFTTFYKHKVKKLNNLQCSSNTCVVQDNIIITNRILPPNNENDTNLKRLKWQQSSSDVNNQVSLDIGLDI